MVAQQRLLLLPQLLYRHADKNQLRARLNVTPPPPAPSTHLQQLLLLPDLLPLANQLLLLLRRLWGRAQRWI